MIILQGCCICKQLYYLFSTNYYIYYVCTGDYEDPQCGTGENNRNFNLKKNVQLKKLKNILFHINFTNTIFRYLYLTTIFSISQLAQQANLNGAVGVHGLSAVRSVVAEQESGKEPACVYLELELPDLKLSSVSARISKKIRPVLNFRVRFYTVRMGMSTCSGMSMML